MPSSSVSILAFGAHPDDLEFGVGGIIARETSAGRAVHCVVCSRGEAGTNGTPAQRTREAQQAAKILGASIEFLKLDGDSHLELKNVHALKLAGIIRKLRPSVVLAPTVEMNQHPDHWRLGQLVRDATRLARYGGVKALKKWPAHKISRLFFYAVAPEAEPAGQQPLLYDISPPAIVKAWTASMEAHASQLKTRNYVEFQLARARVFGMRAGLQYAQALFPNEAMVVESLK
jgi:LmbE family N-acetylglucosaminyl deacetylase